MKRTWNIGQKNNNEEEVKITKEMEELKRE